MLTGRDLVRQLDSISYKANMHSIVHEYACLSLRRKEKDISVNIRLNIRSILLSHDPRYTRILSVLKPLSIYSQRSFIGLQIVPFEFYKNLQRQSRTRTKVATAVLHDEPFISVSVTLYLNCSLTSCAMKALSSVLIVVGAGCSLTSSAITALAFVLFFPLLMYNSDKAVKYRILINKL